MMIWVAVGLIAGNVAFFALLIFGSPDRRKTPDKRLLDRCPKCRWYDGLQVYIFCTTCGTYKANESGVMRLMHWASQPMVRALNLFSMNERNLWLTERRLIDLVDPDHRLWDIWKLDNPESSSVGFRTTWLPLDEAIFEPLERSEVIESSSRLQRLLDDPEVNTWITERFRFVYLRGIIVGLTKKEHSLGDREYNGESDRIRQKKLAVMDAVSGLFDEAHLAARQAWSETVETWEAWEAGQHIICVPRLAEYGQGSATRLRGSFGELGLEVQNLMQRYSNSPSLLAAFRIGLVNKLIRIVQYDLASPSRKLFMWPTGHLEHEGWRRWPARTKVFKAAFGEDMFYEFLGILVAEDTSFRHLMILKHCVGMALVAPFGIGWFMIMWVIMR